MPSLPWLLGELTHAVESGSTLALLAALVWGVLSVLLSPCHLASIPLVVALVTGQDARGGRAFFTAAAFSGGILLSIAMVGGVTVLLGRIAGDLGGGTNYLAAVIFLAVGLHLLEVINLPFLEARPMSAPGRGIWAALGLGVMFGAVLGPCTFAFMAPVLASALKIASAAPIFATFLLLAFGIGHCGVILGAGLSADRVQRYLEWSASSGRVDLLRHTCGLLVLAGGVYLIYSAP